MIAETWPGALQRSQGLGLEKGRKPWLEGLRGCVRGMGSGGREGKGSVHRHGAVLTVTHLLDRGGVIKGLARTGQHFHWCPQLWGPVTSPLQHLAGVREKLMSRDRGQTGNWSGSPVQQMGRSWHRKVHLSVHWDTGQQNTLQSNPRAEAWLVKLNVLLNPPASVWVRLALTLRQSPASQMP